MVRLAFANLCMQGKFGGRWGYVEEFSVFVDEVQRTMVKTVLMKM